VPPLEDYCSISDLGNLGEFVVQRGEKAGECDGRGVFFDMLRGPTGLPLDSGVLPGLVRV
jgi:hypothetical protein